MRDETFVAKHVPRRGCRGVDAWFVADWAGPFVQFYGFIVTCSIVSIVVAAATDVADIVRRRRRR